MFLLVDKALKWRFFVKIKSITNDKIRRPESWFDGSVDGVSE